MEVQDVIEILNISEGKAYEIIRMLNAELKEKGYIIARRTVAKYREQLGIPVARLRKEI